MESMIVFTSNKPSLNKQTTAAKNSHGTIIDMCGCVVVRYGEEERKCRQIERRRRGRRRLVIILQPPFILLLLLVLPTTTTSTTTLTTVILALAVLALRLDLQLVHSRERHKAEISACKTCLVEDQLWKIIKGKKKIKLEKI
jgi:hypothetical protein